MSARSYDKIQYETVEGDAAQLRLLRGAAETAGGRRTLCRTAAVFISNRRCERKTSSDIEVQGYDSERDRRICSARSRFQFRRRKAKQHLSPSPSCIVCRASTSTATARATIFSAPLLTKQQWDMGQS